MRTVGFKEATLKADLVPHIDGMFFHVFFAENLGDASMGI